MSFASGNGKSHCNRCGGPTNHRIIHREHSDWEDDLGHGNSISGSDDYYLLRCGGCDDVQLRHESFFADNGHDYDPTVRIYPPRASRREPPWARGIIWAFGPPSQAVIGDLLSEIYSALQNDSRRSAAMAIRALIETIMIDKIGEQGSLGANVSLFIAAGYVPPRSEKDFRDTLIEGGNAAMHRGWKPSAVELDTMMDLTEWLVASIYVHPGQAAAVTKKIPKRGSN